MQIDVGYPDRDAERKILFETTGSEETHAKPAMTAEDLLAAQRLVRRLPVGESVVDAILAPGQRDIVAHRRLYLDEDTWFAVYADAWDREGKLWKFSHASMVTITELPAVVLGPQFVYDLQYHAYVLDFFFNGGSDGYRVTQPHPAVNFTPEGLAAAGTR